MSAVQRFPMNTSGRDFVVGDIHGCFDALCAQMDAWAFDPKVDRMFSVGDLVDRGAQSVDAVNWIKQPWFHAVRGNHEQMAIGVAAGRHDLANYLQNGGGWFLVLSDEEQQRVAAALDTLPLCIEIETHSGVFGLVHADIEGNDWPTFIDQVENPRSRNHAKQLAEVALWSRDRIRAGDETVVSGVKWLFVGHTPVKQPVRLGNVCYTDTGCVFNGNLTILPIHCHDQPTNGSPGD